MKKVNLLSRAEMKKVMGGNEPGTGEIGGEGGGKCLYCHTSSYNSCWYRANPGDAAQDCQEIYPNSTITYSEYGLCWSTCRMN